MYTYTVWQAHEANADKSREISAEAGYVFLPQFFSFFPARRFVDNSIGRYNNYNYEYIYIYIYIYMYISGGSESFVT